AELLRLLVRRGRLVKEVGNFKRKKQLVFHRPAREREVLARIVSKNRGPYPDEAVQAIWREILSASLALESPLTVAVAGEAAAAAARRRFGTAARLADESGPGAAIDSVAKGFAEYAVLAVEDRSAG